MTLKVLKVSDLASKPSTQTHWGDWHLSTSLNTLTFGPAKYEIDLDRCQSEEAAIDWLLHVAGKTWGTPACIYHLVHALRDLRRLKYHPEAE